MHSSEEYFILIVEGQFVGKSKNAVDDLVRDALSKALQNDEVRLISVGKAPGLFKDAKTASRKAAIAKCLQESPALLREVRTETVREKIHAFVTITEAGLDYLIQRSPPELLSAHARDAIVRETRKLEVMQNRLTAIATDMGRLDAAIGLLATQLATIMEATTNQANVVRHRLQKLADLPGKTPSPPPLAPTPEQHSFLERITRFVVVAWKQAADDSKAKKLIENALFNSGVIRIGKVGDRVSFNHTEHDCSQEVESGEEVEVLQCGWKISETNGELVIEPATVKSTRAN